MTAQLPGVSGPTLRCCAVTALDNVTLEIPEGRMVGLIGPDGWGLKVQPVCRSLGTRDPAGQGAPGLGGDARCGASQPRRLPAPSICRRAWQEPHRRLRPGYKPGFPSARFSVMTKAERERRITDLLAATGTTPFRVAPGVSRRAA